MAEKVYGDPWPVVKREKLVLPLKIFEVWTIMEND